MTENRCTHQPTLQTVRLRLKPRTLDDLEACLEMDRDPAVTRYVPGPWNEPAEHRAFVMARMRLPVEPMWGYWSVFAHDSDTFLGWVFLLPAQGDTPDLDAEIGWRFVQQAWGQGLATEAAAAVMSHGHASGVRRIHAEILRGNTGSVRVASKLGMRAQRSLDSEHGPVDVYVGA